jgi:hypothetical protein
MDIDTETRVSDLERRRENVESVLGSLRIEGLEITPSARALTDRYLRGETSLAELSEAIAQLPV